MTGKLKRGWPIYGKAGSVRQTLWKWRGRKISVYELEGCVHSGMLIKADRKPGLRDRLQQSLLLGRINPYLG